MQVGWVTVPRVGGAGVVGWASTVVCAEPMEVQLFKVAVTVYVPAGAVIVAPDLETPAEGFTV